MGYANGVAPGFPFTDREKDKMIEEATEAFGQFLDALKCDWRNDPNSMETPRRVAKAYVNDLWKGRYTPFTEITSFPSDGYDGIIIERNIQLTECYQSYTPSYVNVSIYTRLWGTALDYSDCLQGPNPYLLQIKCQ